MNKVLKFLGKLLLRHCSNQDIVVMSAANTTYRCRLVSIGVQPPDERAERRNGKSGT